MNILCECFVIELNHKSIYDLICFALMPGEPPFYPDETRDEAIVLIFLPILLFQYACSRFCPIMLLLIPINHSLIFHRIINKCSSSYCVQNDCILWSVMTIPVLLGTTECS